MHDTVRFKLKYNRFYAKYESYQADRDKCQQFGQVLFDAFGLENNRDGCIRSKIHQLSSSQYHLAQTLKKDYVEVTCTPEQFAKFIIFRNQAGVDNWIKELEAEFFSAKSNGPRDDIKPIELDVRR